MEEYQVGRCQTAVEIEQALAIRRKVFVEEQVIPEELEQDGYDAEAIHYLAWVDGIPAGAVRLLPQGREVKLQRMAVLPEFRRQGVGRQIVKKLLADARREGFSRIVLDSQASARIFYLTLGFVEEGLPFLEAGIPHVRMSITLDDI